MFGRLCDHSGLVAEDSDSVVLDAWKSLREIGLLYVKVFRALILLSSTMEHGFLTYKYFYQDLPHILKS